MRVACHVHRVIHLRAMAYRKWSQIWRAVSSSHSTSPNTKGADKYVVWASQWSFAMRVVPINNVKRASVVVHRKSYLQLASWWHLSLRVLYCMQLKVLIAIDLES